MTIKRRTLLLLASAAAASKAYGQANVFTYFGTPTLTSITPVATGPVTGGTSVQINGNNFTLASQVTFAGVLTPFTIVSNTVIMCNTPAVPGGTTTASVIITTPATPATNAPNTAFTYTPVGTTPTILAIYPNAGYGGTFATLVGTGFTGTASIDVDNIAALSFSVIDDTHIDCYMPFHSNGPHPIRVAVGSNTSAPFTFTYGLPEVASLPISPADGSLPNPYGANAVFGTPAVTSKAQWELRKREIWEMHLTYLTGHIPPPSPVTLVSVAADQVITTTAGTMRNLQVNLRTGPASLPINFGMNFYIPLNSGPAGTLFPCIMSGEWAWSPLQGVAPNYVTTISMHASLGRVNLNTCVNRGFVLCEMNRDDFSLDGTVDSQDTNPVELIYNDPAYTSYVFDRRGGPAVSLWPLQNGSPAITLGVNAPPNSGCGGVTGYDASAHGWWMWGFMRCVDYMSSLHGNSSNAFNFIDPNRIGLCGESRGSFPPIEAAAIDKRVAVALPNQGLGIWSGSRYSSNVEGNLGGNSYYFFNTPFVNGYGMPQLNSRYATRYIGNGVTPLNRLFTVFQSYERIPYENSDLMAMIAPRGFCNFGFIGAGGIDGARETKQKFLAGRQAWTAMGATANQMPYTHWSDVQTYSPSPTVGHEMTMNAWTGMIDYCRFHYGLAASLPADVFTAGNKAIWASTSADFANPTKQLTGTPVFGSAIDPAFTWTAPNPLT